MIYLLRILALPGFIIIHLVVIIYHFFKYIYQWLVYGGELDTYSKGINKKTLVDIYKKIEDFNSKMDSEYIFMSRYDYIMLLEGKNRTHRYATPDTDNKITGMHADELHIDEDKGEALQGDGKRLPGMWSAEFVQTLRALQFLLPELAP